MGAAREKHKVEFALAIAYSFRFIFKLLGDAIGSNGNADVFFIVAVIMFLTLGMRKSILKNVCLSLSVLIAIYILSLLFAPYKVDILKGFVWLAKMGLCFISYQIVKREAIRFDLRSFLDYTSLFFVLESIYALINKTNLTWRVFENRMELFFTEPSELGAFVSVLLIIQVYYLREDIICKNKSWNSIRNVFFLMVPLILSQAASAFVYLIVGISIVLFFDIFAFRIKSSTIVNVILLIAIVVGLLAYISLGDSYIATRFQNILNGTDGSFDQRTRHSFELVEQYYSQYGFVGCGFGNQVSEYGMAFFNIKQANYSTCSALATFALEGGGAAVIVTVLFIFSTVKKLITRKDCERIRWALFSFVLLYVYGGGYLTNVVIWMLLGLALSYEFCSEKNYCSVGCNVTEVIK